MWGMPSFSMILDAITSLNGCWRKGLLPPLRRHLLPSMIFHLFFRQPSEVLSGELKSKFPSLFFKPNNTFPISSEKALSKKLIRFHSRSVPSGFIQYWSERLRPKLRTRSIFVSASPISFNASYVLNFTKPCDYRLGQSSSGKWYFHYKLLSFWFPLLRR